MSKTKEKEKLEDEKEKKPKDEDDKKKRDEERRKWEEEMRQKLKVGNLYSTKAINNLSFSKFSDYNN